MLKVSDKNSGSSSQAASIASVQKNLAAEKTQKKEFLKEKFKKRAVIMIVISTTALILYTALFFYKNTTAYLKAAGQIQTMQAQILEYDDQILPELKSKEEEARVEYDQEFDEIIKALDQAFPEEIDKLGIAMLLEDFATEVNNKFPPFELTAISLGGPTQGEGYRANPTYHYI